MSIYDYLLLFGGMGIVTYLPRWLPLFFLAQRELPTWLEEWLKLIPVAILCGLLAPILFTDETSRSLDLGKPELLVAIPTLLFAVKTKSLGGSVLVGMGLYWGYGLLGALLH